MGVLAHSVFVEWYEFLRRISHKPDVATTTASIRLRESRFEFGVYSFSRGRRFQFFNSSISPLAMGRSTIFKQTSTAYAAGSMMPLGLVNRNDVQRADGVRNALLINDHDELGMDGDVVPMRHADFFAAG